MVPRNPNSNEPIAIIGSGCRFPGGSSSPSKLWEMLKQPRDVLSTIPIERFNTNGVYHPNGMHHGSTNVRSSYLLAEDHRLFDAAFFNIKPVEAQSVDPQQRLLLETVYEALESAGLSMEGLRGSDTAVYVGLMANEYADMLSADIDNLPTYFATATAASIISNRISYFFDWRGASMTIDTACSSSLVAIHQAVQTLRNGDSKVAIAAGANLILGPKPYISENKLNMLSPGSRSRMWDVDADGYARGEGVAALILKPLTQAIADGDDIECIIRETGVNQDGRTRGITMPSGSAQEMLIRQTYAKAGLNLSRVQDRPQFFEAHGTGTPAGDPQEAEAIHNSFFGAENAKDISDVLHVGSIKTVIGHTEGTAGIAGILKVMMAMKDGTIPPNMLFKTLNPAVAPFYGKIRIPTSALPWPDVSPNHPRRASVNSFGFGGTNAHAIVESYSSPLSTESAAIAFLPIIFSATSEASLRNTVESFTSHLKSNQSISMRDLAHTLAFRRSKFPFRIAFSGMARDVLIDKMQAFLEHSDSPVTATSPSNSPKILGVFTGQGAQWPTMGRELVLHSKWVRDSVERLDTVLSRLPQADRPGWSLMQELLREPSDSRLDQAAVSQPLCTAVQIILVDILHAAGIQFNAVVGHSSGEIGAAYAAGYISAEDALKIAYYRGVHSTKASSTTGTPGAMMAVGTSLEDATDLCTMEDMVGRICVAACNSSSSITLSGDVDAIDEAMETFQDEKKFARKLKVDTAYHSHHMRPCAGPYTRSLERCGIQILPGAGSNCTWFSSVTGQPMAPEDPSLTATYWRDNMTMPVMFAQAVHAAHNANSSFGVAFELGPHPALKGPALQTLSQGATGAAVPYSGLLQRGKNDVDALADAVAFASAHISDATLDLHAFDSHMSGHAPSRMIKGLPSYVWDHDRVYWQESRIARLRRTRDTPIHELLGTLSVEGSTYERRWRNIISPVEIPWLTGHQLQGQTVFPAAGYVAMAIEAARELAGSRSIRLLDMHELVISKAMVFESDDSRAEVLFTLTIQHEASTDTVLRADFVLEGTLNPQVDELATFFSGHLDIHLGDAEQTLLPGRTMPLIDAVDVDPEHFYSSLAGLGYHYSGFFKSLQAMWRATDSGTATITQPKNSQLLVHPATLDCAIQAVILAFSWPGDNRLWSLHVPTKITRLQLNPTLMASDACHGQSLSVDSFLAGDVVSSKVSGDVSIYGTDSSEAVMQLEGVEIVPFTAASPEMDTRLFFNMNWDVANPNGECFMRGIRATPQHHALGASIDRVAYLYMKAVLEDVSEIEWANAEWHFKQVRVFANEVISAVENGDQEGCDPAWKHDTREQIGVELKKWPGNIDLKLLKVVGDNLAAAIRGQTLILEHMLHDNILNDFYRYGLGLDIYTDVLNNAVQQIAHRYPNMSILEIGAGTGGVTKTIIKELGNSFASYTYTDISSGFFDTAREVFWDTRDRMVFKTLDVEKDPRAQGFAEHSFDLIICSLVLHATESLERTLTNVRGLLKPGGYLALLEITNMSSFRTGFAMSALPGWWLGHKDGRPMNPCVSADRWDAEFKKTRFSGIDAITPDLDPVAWPFSVIIAQATDDQVQSLRQPLSFVSEQKLRELVLIGGAAEPTKQLGDRLEHTLQSWYQRIIRINAIEEYDEVLATDTATVLSFVDLDTPIFKNLTEQRLAGLRNMLECTHNVVWVSKGARGQDPYAAMMTGFFRTVVMEMPHLRSQLLDIGTEHDIKPEILAETLLRLELTEAWETDDSNLKMLWSTEPELSLENEVLRIPRLYGLMEQNYRYNANRRHISKEVDPTQSTVTLAANGNNFVDDFSTQNSDISAKETAMIRVNYSLPLAVRISSHQCLFVVSGTLNDADEEIFALSPMLASTVTVPNKWIIPSPSFTRSKADVLVTAAFHLVAQFLTKLAPAGSTLLIKEAPEHLGRIISETVAKRSVHCALLEAQPTTQVQQVIHLHPNASVRQVRSSLPHNVAVFANFGGKDALGNTILQSLSSSSAVLNASELFSNTAFERAISPDNASALLGSLMAQLSNDSIVGASVTSLREVMASGSSSPYQVIDWTASTTVPIKVGPVDKMVSFAPDKTYILFGLTGQIGRSLALWMAGQGAKHIVLTSRNPAVDKLWLTKARDKGAEIYIIRNDITDRRAVVELVNKIRATMPPIAGIANGAMILQDSALSQMSLEKMAKVLRPKVDGTTYLDELFQDNSLDFFIVFTSVANIFGQHGQSNYTAANMFMNAIVHRRRRNGLAGSVMALGAVMGLGYIWREVDDQTRGRIEDRGFRAMSERDLHQVFGEAVLASPLGASTDVDNYEIIAGVREMEYGKDRNTVNPIFGHATIYPRGSGTAEQESVTKAALKLQILSAATEAELFAMIQDAFLAKLKSILQLSSAPGLETGAEELGIDSLIAVEIRTWFIKELNMDMPVLKILGGATVGAMIDFAIEKLPTSMVPNLDRKDAAALVIQVSDASSTDSLAASLASKDTRGDELALTPNSPLDSLSMAAHTEPMSYSQSRFWFLASLLEDATAFNITFSIELRGHIEPERLVKAVDKVGQRHAALRTRFFDSDSGEAMQEVLPYPAFSMQIRDITRAEDITEEFDRMRRHKYDLVNGDLIQFTLIRVSTEIHSLIIGYHHINMDAVSLKNLLTDMDKVYRGLRLSHDVAQYPDHAAAQRRAFEQGDMEDELSYWRKEFPTIPAVLPLLPFSDMCTRQPQTSYGHSKVQSRITSQTARRIKAVCSKHKISPYHFHLTAFQTLLARLLAVDDICIGMADANRTESAQLEAVGLYLNLLPLRLKHDGARSFLEAVKHVQSKVRQALAHSRLPFDVLVEQLNPERSMEYSPIFQAFIDYKPPIPAKTSVFNCVVGKEEYEIGQTAYDITLSIVDEPDGAAEIVFQLQRSLYSTDDANMLLQSYMWLLEQLGESPEVPVDSVSLVSPVDEESMAGVGAGPVVESGWPETISHRVQQIIERHPDAPALVDSGRTVSYRALNSKINTLTTHLLERKLGPGSVIAVCQEPGFDWLSSFLAVLRIGAVYIPFDVRIPAARLIAVSQEARILAVLAHSPTLRLARSLGPRGPPVIDVSTLAKRRTDKMIPSAPSAKCPAYIFYTSGSTGVPKGVVVGHEGLSNSIEHMVSACGIGPGSRIMQQSAFSFDASILQTLLGVATGACVVFASNVQRADPVALVALIVSHKVNVLFGTPSEYLWWTQSTDIKLLQQSHVSVVITGGEKLRQSVLDVFRSLQKPELRSWDAYGPTEMTIFSNIVELDYHKQYDRMPVGPAIRNTATYVVDQDLRPVPVGISGEILLAGVGVAQGYLDAELTKTRFLPNPFASSDFSTRGWTTMYRTGDMGRLTKNGTLSIDGRISGDTQVKIRGVRIELQDIERNIIESADGVISEAVVSVRGDAQASFLAAHVVFARGRKPEEAEAFLHALLASLALPQYMCPSVIIPLDRLPITQNFKLDRPAIRTLPLPKQSKPVQADVQLSKEQNQLRNLWIKVLPKKVVGSTVIDERSDFFHVGGNSMLLARVGHEIKRTFGVQVPLRQLFERSTLGEMAVQIVRSEMQDVRDGEPIDWDTEVAVPDELRATLDFQQPPRLNPKTIILTGSTGFLGRTLLHQLVQDESIEKIHCVAVREAASRTLPVEFSSPKVVVHSGSLTQPHLGLSEHVLSAIFASADAIIHNGADVSFMKSYRTLRPTNVSATKTLFSLAAARRIPFHYISTSGVAHLSKLPEFPEISAAIYHPPTDGSDGYVASKWASEVFLENASNMTQTPVVIHRPSSIMGDDVAPTDLMGSLFKYSLRLQTVPILQIRDKSKWEGGYADLIDVANAARGVLDSVKAGGSEGDPVRFLYQAGEMVVPMAVLVGGDDAEGGLGMQPIPLREWVERARNEGMNELVAELLSSAEHNLKEKTGDMESFLLYPRLVKERGSQFV